MAVKHSYAPGTTHTVIVSNGIVCAAALLLTGPHAPLPCRYWLLDGTYLGNAGTRNEDPYAHFAYQFQDLLTGYEGTRNCTIAHSSYSYDLVSGWQFDRLVYCLPAALPCCITQARMDAPGKGGTL
jgi:hypothetical protein